MRLHRVRSVEDRRRTCSLSENRARCGRGGSSCLACRFQQVPGWNWGAQGGKARPSQEIVVILIKKVASIRLGWNNKRQRDILSGIIFRRR